MTGINKRVKSSFFPLVCYNTEMLVLEDVLTGRTQSHTVPFPEKQLVHRDVLEPLNELKKAAEQAGFKLGVCSSFRSFDRQVQIWNAKVSGATPVLNSLSIPMDIKSLSPEKLIEAILRWSALPGTSRHHWGTDFDVIDLAQLNAGTSFRLVPEEFESGSLFGKLHDWLDENMESYGFFRPYQIDRGGVSPERWHLSYAPLAQSYLSQHSEELVRKVLEPSELRLKKEVLTFLPEIWKKFVTNITPPHQSKVL